MHAGKIHEVFSSSPLLLQSLAYVLLLLLLLRRDMHFGFLVEVLLLLLLRAAAAAHNISTEGARGTAYCFFLLRLRYYYCFFLCVYSIFVAAFEKGYALLFFGRGAAAAKHFSCCLR